MSLSFRALKKWELAWAPRARESRILGAIARAETCPDISWPPLRTSLHPPRHTNPPRPVSVPYPLRLITVNAPGGRRVVSKKENIKQYWLTLTVLLQVWEKAVADVCWCILRNKKKSKEKVTGCRGLSVFVDSGTRSPIKCSVERKRIPAALVVRGAPGERRAAKFIGCNNVHKALNWIYYNDQNFERKMKTKHEVTGERTSCFV